MKAFNVPGEVIEVGSERYYELQRHQAAQAVAEGPAGLRDRFAMAALTGLIGGYLTANRAESWENFALMAYYAADAMLTTRDVELP